MKQLSGRAAPFRTDRPSTQLLHDSEDLRVVAFALEPGQEVRPHRSTSAVLLQVIEGEGEFSGANGIQRVVAGDAVAYDREELHGIRANAGRLRFLAIITPRPG